MLELQRIPPSRQRIVASALDEYLKTKPDLSAKVLASAKHVVKNGEGLHLEPESVPMVKVDNSTDAVASALVRLLDDRIRLLDDTVIPRGDAQKAAYEAATLVRAALFPHGVAFIRQRYSLEWDALTSVRRALGRDEVKAAVSTLGLDDAVGHLLAHIALYGKTLGVQLPPAEEGSEESASLTFHEAFQAFTIDVLSDIKDPAQRRPLLGVYEAQLDEHREDLRNERKRKSPREG